jgi:putative membrane protein
MSKARIWKRAAGVSAIALLFGASVASAQSTQNSSTGTQSTQGTQGATSQPANTTATTGRSAASGTVSRADKKLMVEMAQANLAEIEAAHIAQSKTQNDQVRNFAQQMIDDHTRALQDLQQLAQAKGVTLPTEADSKHKKMGQKMRAMSGASFDRRYMAQSGVSDHKKTDSLLRRVQSRASDPDLKALAARLQPVVEQHLNSVQQLQTAMRSGRTGTASGTSTSGTSGGGNAGNTNTQQQQQQQQQQQPQQRQQ